MHPCIQAYLISIISTYSIYIYLSLNISFGSAAAAIMYWSVFFFKLLYEAFVCNKLPVRPVKIRAVDSNGEQLSGVVFQDNLSLLAAVQVDPLDPVCTRIAPV